LVLLGDRFVPLYHLGEVKIGAVFDRSKNKPCREAPQIIDNVVHGLLTESQNWRNGHDVALPFGQNLLDDRLFPETDRQDAQVFVEDAFVIFHDSRKEVVDRGKREVVHVGKDRFFSAARFTRFDHVQSVDVPEKEAIVEET
jgi:hypothetical protein